MGCCNSKPLPTPRLSYLPTTLSCYQLNSPISNSGGVHKGDFIQVMAGSINSRYKIQGILGEGAFGTVYQVKDKKTNMTKAMKELPKEKMSQEEIQEVIHQIGVLRELDHPHVMKIYQVVQDKKAYFIISQFLPGGELFDKIASMSSLNQNMAAVYIRDILNALAYLHDHGIVHRDLKPENIMLDSLSSEGTIKIIDFGISAKLIPNSTLSDAIGTVFYMAPETFDGDYNEKCDIWSAGVILYIMLGGEFPFKANTDSKAMVQIRKGNYNFNSPVWKGISEEGKNLISLMMKIDPIERLSARQALHHPWIENRVSDDFKVNKTTLAAFANLKKFHANNKIQKSILTYISSQLLHNKHSKQLIDIFKALDANHDGKLSQDQIVQGYTKLGRQNSTDFEAIMEKCDMDHNGYLDYTEFLLATHDWQDSINRDLLKKTFDVYDDTGNGQLSIQELKRHIPGIQDSEWNQFFFDADTDGNGQISLKQLQDYLKTSLNWSK